MTTEKKPRKSTYWVSAFKNEMHGPAHSETDLMGYHQMTTTNKPQYELCDMKNF